MPHTVALIGLGAMGSGVGRCLLHAGFAVRGNDIRAEPLQGLRHAGGVACATADEAGRGAEVAVLFVLNADQAEDVAFGEHGLVHSLPPEAVIVSATTMAPSRARAVAARAEQAGLRWLDAPVSGGTQRAAEGTLTSMVGGDANDLERARPVLQAFSGDVFHLGPVGAGSTAKMVNQVLVYNHLAAAAEAMALCRKLGADGQSVYDVICTSMGASAIFQSRVPRILDGTFESGGSLAIALKDLGIVEETARELGIPMPMSAQATQLFRATAAAEGVDQDDLVVARLTARLAGVPY
jgi:L-threonate 2-dehydrogenase